MPLQALSLVIVAALAHSTWNVLFKCASGSKHLLFFSSAIEAALFTPLAVWLFASSWALLSWKAWLFFIATGVLHLWYSESLLHGYRASALSVVYPLARGSGPLLSFVGAILFLHEHVSILGTSGALLITLGILLSSGGGLSRGHTLDRTGLFWGITTGLTIACYTLVDAYSVKVLLLSPLLVEYAGNVFRAVLLSLGILRQRPSLSVEFRSYWRYAFAIAVLVPIGYILVLFAMKLAPVSQVAPVREMSMMIGAYFGVKFLHEGHGRRRLFGSALIAAGVAAIATG